MFNRGTRGWFLCGSFVCRILPTAFVIVLSWVERRWVFSVIGCLFQLRHAEKKGVVQPVAPQQLLWLWVQLWVLGTDSDSRTPVHQQKRQKTVSWNTQWFALNASSEGVC